MRDTPRSARIGAVLFALWGLAHVVGGALQVSTLRSNGAGALTAMIATATPAAADAFAVPAAAAAFMGMGAFNIMWIGALVTFVAIRYNWRNSRSGYLLNMFLVAATDAALLTFLLIPGQMAWSDGAVGLSLFALAIPFATSGVLRAPRAVTS